MRHRPLSVDVFQLASSFLIFRRSLYSLPFSTVHPCVAICSMNNLYHLISIYFLTINVNVYIRLCYSEDRRDHIFKCNVIITLFPIMVMYRITQLILLRLGILLTSYQISVYSNTYGTLWSRNSPSWKTLKEA